MAAIKVPYFIDNTRLREEFITEILPLCVKSLKKQTEPVWGIMKAQHMIEHLFKAFEISTGNLRVRCTLPEKKIKDFQAFLYSDKPMPRGIKNPALGDKLPELLFPDLEEAKDQLLNEVQYFWTYYEKHPDATQISPFFGELNAEQWQRYHFKHCFHHLSQFGLVEISNE